MPEEGSSRRNANQKRERNNFWKGEQVVPFTGNDRARRWFPLPTVCAECEVAPATDRHHWDGNPLNNDRNVVGLCRRCHMRIDGRLEGIRKQGLRDKTKPPRPCAECGRLAKPLSRGLCNACYLRHWKAGTLP